MQSFFRYFVAAVLLVLTRGALAQTPWNLASSFADDSFQTENLRFFAAEVDKATQGKVKLTVHSHGALFKGYADITRAVADGAKAQLGEFQLYDGEKDIPVLGVDAVPFLALGYPDARRLWQKTRPLIAKKLEERGLKPLYAVPWPPQGLFINRPLRSMGELKGLRLRTQNTGTKRIAELVDAKAVDVPAPDLKKALHEKKLDAFITASLYGSENGAWEYMNYFYDLQAWMPKNAVVINLKLFNSLDAPTKEALLRVAALAEERGWKVSQEQASRAKKELADKGMKVLQPGDYMSSDMQLFGERLSREWVKGAGLEVMEPMLEYFKGR